MISLNISSKKRLSNIKSLFCLVVLIVSLLLVAGCNGGGGDDSSSDDDSSGNTDSSVNVSPTASFTVSSSSATTETAMVFDGSGSTDSDGSIEAYAWDLGDGSSGSGKTVTHTYQIAGTYTVQLTVTDNDGATGTDAQTVEISEAESVEQTISGTVTSAENMFADTDVNDPNANYTSNDSFDLAQEITLVDDMATVSGFVNVDNSGTMGDRFATSGDYEDYYQAALSEELAVTLYMVEDAQQSEIDLYLYDSSKTQIGYTTTNSNGIASLTVPSDGTYYIRVVAVETGAVQTSSMYALIFGQIEASETGQLSVNDNFVSGEALVRFDENQSDVVSMSAGESNAVSALGLATKAGRTSRDKLLKPSTSTDRDTLFETLGVKAAFTRSVASGHMDGETEEKMETLWMIRGLRNQSGVQYAEPNYIRKAFNTPDDTNYSKQWNLPLINLEEAWDVSTGSSSVIVAVVDTGVLLNHPDLQDKLVSGYDFISDDTISGDSDSGIDDDPNDTGDQDNSDGTSSFHGTHVAGIIAAESNNASGVAGVAWDVKIMPVRALGIGGGTTYDVMQAVKYAAGLDNDSGTVPDNPADIINLSLGGSGATTYEQEIYDDVRDQGVIVIAAAGNESSDTKSYPAAYDGVVAVSAVDSSKNFASYSNYGSTIDVSAPGGSSSEQVYSTCGDDSSDISYTYEYKYGTSMATPHVSGVAALMKSIYSDLTPDSFDGLLAGEYLTEDLGDSGWDEEYGYGMIDAKKAVDIAYQSAEDGTTPAVLSVSPSSISFGSSMTTSDVTVSSQGEETLTVESAVSDATWLSVAATDVDSSNLGTYTITVDRSGLSDGSYSGTITFSGSSQNDATVDVTMCVGDYADTTDGGYHYVLLVDPDTYKVLGTFSSAGEDGVYEFSLTGAFENKSVLIYAGTDANHDGIICDEAEACGAYPSLDEPEEVLITDDLNGIDFMTDINVNLPGMPGQSNMATSKFAVEGFPLELNTTTDGKNNESKDSGIRLSVP